MNSWPSPAFSALKAGLTLPTLQLTNTKSNSVEALQIKNLYRMYVCGITPYDATHLGHAATYLTFDLINRYLQATGAKVSYVQNITDIDDPLLERAQRDGQDWKELATSQIDLFRGDMFDLRILPPEHYIGAVESIELVSASITELISANTIYTIDKDYYFRNYSSSEFGRLSHLNESEMAEIFSQRGGNPTLAGKENPLDCLVWMSQRPGEPGWVSVHGIGRPGWHIECTAIALNYLQPDSNDATCIDIQGGGSDLIFPHHEMCASQARVLTGKELAMTYVHSAMIGLDGEKMSKSKGNLVFVSTLVNSGEDPMAIRLALLSQHYRLDRMWSSDVLEAATLRLNTWRRAFVSGGRNCETTIDAVIRALSNDLDTPTALAAIDSWAEESSETEVEGNNEDLRQVIDTLLGIVI